MGVEQVAAPELVNLPEGDGWWGVGRGWAAYSEILTQRMGEQLTAVEADLLCSAQDIAQLAVRGYEAGEAVAAELALPVYLRDQVAKKPA